MTWRQRALLLAGAALVVVACPRLVAVWLIRPTTAGELEFGVSSRRGSNRSIDFHYLTVRSNPCPWKPAEASEETRALMWEIVDRLDGTSAPHPTRVKYGEVPRGFDAVTPAEPLEAGCYEVRVDGTGATLFTVTSGGSARELEPGDTTFAENRL